MSDLIARMRPALSKVPEITVMFWVAKLLTTGMGETTWDWFDGSLGQAVAVSLTSVLFVAAMVTQFAVRAYNPWAYWFAIVMVSVFGTTIADLAHNDFGIPYTVSTLVLLGLVGLTFALWYRVEGTLSIHSITTRRREVFYWTAVLLTFALGTAAGDWTASTLHLGYLPSGLIFLVAFVLPAVAYRWFGLNAIVAFWLSYIMTRPLGASFADYFGGPRGRGGIALGMEPVSIVLTVVIVAVVAYFAITRVDRPRGLAACATAEIASSPSAR
ncbi:COG4705 family protein [Actinomycetospora sp. CA-053990]|uniref:COG4705 family protein n=1 Tax=Actinomycetospora sp. CA-053990 TaxID=3239891 RepID=UPI003D91AD8A